MHSLEDRRAIEDLYIQYNHAVDRHDIDSWVGVYAVDAVFQGRIRLEGHEQIRDFAEGESGRLRRRGYARTQHRTSNLIVQVDGERARATCDLIILLQPIDPRWAYEFLVASYDDELVKIDGRWFFQSRRVDWWPPAVRPAAARQPVRRRIRRLRRWLTT